MVGWLIKLYRRQVHMGRLLVEVERVPQSRYRLENPVLHNIGFHPIGLPNCKSVSQHRLQMQFV
jgi:hypothetical protein